MATKIEDRPRFLRQHYAGQAMQALVAAEDIYFPTAIPPDRAKLIAQNAFTIADAMVAEASKAREL